MALIETNDYGNDLLTERNPSMTLLSGPLCIFSHCCRMVLIEKDIECSIEYISGNDDPTRLAEINPYLETPSLRDRDLTLYDTWVVIEYLDERFPHPPLMPIDPVNRGKTRLVLSRLMRDWLQPVNQLGETATPNPSAELKKSIHDGLLALSPLFAQQPFFQSTEYTLADAYIIPLLWRLPALGIDLPKQAKPVIDYAERMFARPTFAGSLSPQEAGLR